MPRIPNKQRIALVVFGLLLSAVLLETGLRLAGFIVSSVQERRNVISLRQKHSYRILCIGESTTAGGEQAYPAQLEKVLNQRFPDIKFSVINRGVPGISTGGIVKGLDANLGRYKPDLVIAMMGINDRYYYARYVQARDPGFFGFLRDCRIYKLIMSLRLHIVNKVHGENKIDNIYNYLYGRIDYPQAERILKKCIARDPGNSFLYLRLGQWYISQRRAVEAEEALRKAIQLKPDSANAYAELGRWCVGQGRYSEGEKYINKAMQLEPASAKVYIELGRCYMAQEKYHEAEDIFRRAIALDPGFDTAYAHLAFCYAQAGNQELADRCLKKAYDIRLNTINSTTSENYKRVREVLAKKGIRFVCMQYPMISVRPLKSLFYSTDGITFVDNEEVFKEAVRRSKYEDYFSDNFAGDFGHCTLKGNRLLAEHIADVLSQECPPFKNRL